MLAHFTGSVYIYREAASNSHLFRVSAGGDKIRTERFASLMSYEDAFSFVSDFYTDKKKLVAASESFKSGRSDAGQRILS
jgi:hypothetical protein